MAVKIDIPGIGEVTADNFAQEDTLQKLLAVMGKTEKTKRAEEQKRIAQEKELSKLKKEEAEQIKKTSSLQEKAKNELDKLIQNYGKSTDTLKDFQEDVGAISKKMGDTFADLTVTVGNLAGKFLQNYDKMVEDPIAAGAGILETMKNITAQIANIAVDVGTALGKIAVGWVPFIGAGLAAAVGALGTLGHKIVNFASEIFTTVNQVLEREFQKRVFQLDQFMKLGGSFAGGMTEMGQLANQSGIGIKTFTNAVVAARPYITDMGLTVGDATRLLAKNMSALGTTVGKGGKTVRDELLALGYSYEEQGSIMAQYMAQLKTTGVNLQAMAPAQLAKLTGEYAKHLKVLTDITGQNARQLMDQSRAEAQRGALMDSLTAAQSRAFQDAYATLAAMPAQQGPKLQSALAQVLAGGVVTDPVIAGNKIIMDMLKQTAAQVSAGNVNMVVATQSNLGRAAEAYRAAGESATDFATLMNPGGTSAVAQGMSQFGNALRQYRYDPTAAEASMTAADGQATASDALTSSYVTLTGTMNDFQNAMETLAQEALPTYAKVMASAAANTAGIVTTGIKLVLGQIGLLKAFSDITGYDLSKIPGLSSIMGGTAPSAADVQNTGSGAGESLASAQSSSKQSPYQGKGGTLEGTYSPPSAASGGILSGSTSGFAATLHGTEAVVPLPDNRTIPVSLDSSSLTAAVNQQTGVLTQILSSMNKNNSLTSGILQASM
jgi:hypothetical protein